MAESLAGTISRMTGRQQEGFLGSVPANGSRTLRLARPGLVRS